MNQWESVIWPAILNYETSSHSHRQDHFVCAEQAFCRSDLFCKQYTLNYLSQSPVAVCLVIYNRLVSNKNEFGEQCWRSGEISRLSPMWPRIDSRTRRHMWVEFVGSLLCCERFFLGSPVSPSHQKPIYALIYVDLIWFPVSPISRASVLGLIRLRHK